MTEDIRTKAAQSVEATLEGGQSVSQGDMQVSKASLKDAHAIMVHEDVRTAGRTGRRPLFRGINMSGVR
jgi:hypothetical protein